MSEFITCPKCGAKVPLTEAIAHQMSEQLEARLAHEVGERDKQHQEALSERERVLRGEFDAVLAEREATLVQKAEEKVATDLADLQQRVAEQETQLEAARAAELELRREKRELDDARASLELDVARRMEQERKKVAEDATQRLSEEFRLKLAEKELALEQMQEQIKHLEDSAEQTRAGLRGEVLERDVESVLREAFPRDTITPVKAGVRGADVLQTVRSSRGVECGRILWESKRAKAWSNGWVSKLKDDQRAAKSEVGVVVSSTVPDAVQFMGAYEGVWVAETAYVVALASPLREGLIAVSQARSIDTNKSEALGSTYEYICGPDFKQRIETAVRIYVELKGDLDSERRSLEAHWRKRETHLNTLVMNTAGMYGELQAVTGTALGSVEMLELPSAG